MVRTLSSVKQQSLLLTLKNITSNATKFLFTVLFAAVFLMLIISKILDRVPAGNLGTPKRTTIQIAEQKNEASRYYLARTPVSPGSRRLYIDLGANCGNSYFRAKDNKTIGTLDTLKRPSPDVWEAYLWECNPQLIDWYLHDLVQNEGPDRVLLVPAAASTTNGEISFYLTAGQEHLTKDEMPNSECDPDSQYQPGGASSIFGTAERAGSSITVPTFNFFEWHRGLNLVPGDVVHMKLDIEGAEVDILEEFLLDESNQICYWKVFWMEYHKDIFLKDSDEYKRHEKFETMFPARYKQKCGTELWPNEFIR